MGKRSAPANRTKRVTFGELAIGEFFWWRDTDEIKHGPRGPEPMCKGSATAYGWSRGSGTAERHYPVERTRPPVRPGAAAGGPSTKRATPIGTGRQQSTKAFPPTAEGSTRAAVEQLEAGASFVPLDELREWICRRCGQPDGECLCRPGSTELVRRGER